MEENCDSWVVVDFGEGQIRIRCTRTDEHEQHYCHVVWSDTIENPEFRD